jgi:hypothetical protein
MKRLLTVVGSCLCIFSSTFPALAQAVRTIRHHRDMVMGFDALILTDQALEAFFALLCQCHLHCNIPLQKC